MTTEGREDVAAIAGNKNRVKYRQFTAPPIQLRKAIRHAVEPWRFAEPRQVKFMNNVVVQDHLRIKRLGKPGLGFTQELRVCLAGTCSFRGQSDDQQGSNCEHTSDRN
jgi:hypothetical protein